MPRGTRALCAQRKYWACTAIFSSWVVRSGGPPLVEWDAREKAFVPTCDAGGAVRVPSPEMIVDYLLQVGPDRGGLRAASGRTL